MQKVTRYLANDGELFLSEAGCLEYEQQCVDARDATDILRNGGTLLEALTTANQTRPWWGENFTPEEKELLANITEDTPIQGYLRQRQSFSYKIQEIDCNGKIYIGGYDEDLGPCGNWVTLSNLLTYLNPKK